MSRKYLSPGVYVQERDISNIIPTISTTSAGLVGFSKKGSLEVTLVTNSQQFIEEYGKPEPGNYFHYTALAYLENGSVLYCRRVINGALYGGADIMAESDSFYNELDEDNAGFAIGQASDVFYYDSTEDDVLFNIFGKDPGAWNNDIAIVIKNVVSTYYDGVAKRTAVIQDQYTFEIEVWYLNDDGDYELVETWKVSRQEKTDGYGRQLYLEDKINGFSKYITVQDNTNIPNTVLPKAQASLLALSGGTDGNDVTSSELVTGWQDFANPDDVDIRLLLNGGQTSVSVQSAMLTIAEDRLDCVAIFDLPYSQLSSIQNMVNWRKDTQNFNSSYCALYSPWVKIYDPYSDKIIEVPPSGYIASQIAYNDYRANTWYAPAGFNRGILNVLGITTVFTEGERDTLYEAQINPLQTFRGQGNVIWGQKTQQVKASALDRLNVRRLLIVIEKSIAISLRSFAFEPNSELTRFRIKAMIDEYMGQLSASGAFQTEAGDQGFQVVCDERNNTPAVIDANELHVDIFIKPSRAAEYIQLQTIITRTGASFEELISKGVLF